MKEGAVQAVSNAFCLRMPCFSTQPYVLSVPEDPSTTRVAEHPFSMFGGSHDAHNCRVVEVEASGDIGSDPRRGDFDPMRYSEGMYKRCDR
jgi:hypothetical protein